VASNPGKSIILEKVDRSAEIKKRIEALKRFKLSKPLSLLDFFHQNELTNAEYEEIWTRLAQT